MSNSHLVDHLSLDRHVALHAVLDGNVKISVVSCIWAALESTGDDIACIHCELVSGVEDGVLPMGVFGVRTSAEAHRLVARVKGHVEPAEESMHVCR